MTWYAQASRRRSPKPDGSMIWIDVTVIETEAPTYLDKDIDALIAEREAAKFHQYAQAAAIENANTGTKIRIVPMVFTTSGKMGTMATKYIKETAKRVRSDHGRFRRAFYRKNNIAILMNCDASFFTSWTNFMTQATAHGG